METQETHFEFGGPIGAACIVFALPLLMNALYFFCNDVSGCPAPALLSMSSLTWSKLRPQIPWPESGLRAFVSWEVTAWLGVYYVVSLILHVALPAHEVLGMKLKVSGKPLSYRFNAFSSTVIQLAACIIGTVFYGGASFPVWTFIYSNYLQLLTANILLSFAISIYVYIASFSIPHSGIKSQNGNDSESSLSLRELAQGGVTGTIIYDFFIGRELNPRFSLSFPIPFLSVTSSRREIDLKTFLEMRPGLTGWVLLNLSFVAKQYNQYGYVSDSILLVTAIQAYYVLEGQYAEAGIVSMMDITTDGLGFMLVFGDIVWVPFLYSGMCRYLSTYPVHLGWTGVMGIGCVFVVGVWIFRAANSQKHLFRKHPTHPSVAAMPYIQTKRGTKLLTGGWWRMARHVNYLGDWIQSLPFCLPTGISGYTILPAGSGGLAGLGICTMLDGRQVMQDEVTRGWGMLFTYFYSAWFAFMLVHRERRDDRACGEKYGQDWDEYKRIVRWRIIPGIY